MAPGPKKKNLKKGISDNSKDQKRSSSQNCHIEKNDKCSKNSEELSVLHDSENSKFGKLPINSNWSRYDEPVDDPYADKMRGDDFGVLLSSSGGSSSHLKLQEEKDWEDASLIENNLVLDFEDLISAVKCIPFHKRINLPENIFEENQIQKFISCSEKWKKAYKSKPILQMEEPLQEDETIEILENEESDNDDFPVKNYGIDENTGNIIDSLTTSLSLTKLTKESFNDSIIDKKDDPKQSDDLDFLLSLSIPSRDLKCPTNNENKTIEKSANASVDDWLSNILDD